MGIHERPRIYAIIFGGVEEGQQCDYELTGANRVTSYFVRKLEPQSLVIDQTSATLPWI